MDGRSEEGKEKIALVLGERRSMVKEVQVGSGPAGKLVPCGGDRGFLGGTCQFLFTFLPSALAFPDMGVERQLIGKQNCGPKPGFL